MALAAVRCWFGVNIKPWDWVDPAIGVDIYIPARVASGRPRSIASLWAAASGRQVSPYWPSVALWAQTAPRQLVLCLHCAYIILLCLSCAYFAVSNQILCCSEYSLWSCVMPYILFFHEPAFVFCCVTTANVSPSLLLSHGPHSAQPALRGLQTVCRGQGSGLLSKRRRVLHHWNGGRGSQTLQVSLMAFFFLLFFLYLSNDTNVSVTRWSHPAADLEVNVIHPAFHFFFSFFVRVYVCVLFLGTYSLIFFLPPKLKCVSVVRLGPLYPGIRYAAAASHSGEA